jgi:hypothetical protein
MLRASASGGVALAGTRTRRVRPLAALRSALARTPVTGVDPATTAVAACPGNEPRWGVIVPVRSHETWVFFLAPVRAGVGGRHHLGATMTDGQPNKPNFLVIWGDDIGITNLSCYSDGLMGYRTPNIDRIANEGMRFTDAYGEQSCTAGRAAFITGQNVFRTGLSKVGMPGADLGMRAEDPTIAELLKPLGYATGQLGKNHLG